MPRRFAPALEPSDDRPRSRDILKLVSGPWMNSQWSPKDYAGHNNRASGALCVIDRCQNVIHSSGKGTGLCYGHYWRWHRDGEPAVEPWIRAPQKPLRVRVDRRVKRKIHFDELPPDIAHELRFVFGSRLAQGDWTPTADLVSAVEALRDAALLVRAESFVDRRPEDWLLLCQEVCPRAPSAWRKNVRPYIRTFFHTLNRALILNPWAEDEWYWKDQFEHVLGGDRWAQRNNIYWNGITQDWLREPLKSYARQCLQTGARAWQTVQDWSEAFGSLSSFLSRNNIDSPPDLDRMAFLLFLGGLRANDTSKSNLAHANQAAAVLTVLKIDGFVPDLGSEIYLRPGENAISKKKAPRPWPSDVLRRIETEVINDAAVDPQLRLMLRFARWCGPRVSELVMLPIDSLIENGNGGFWIEYWMPKVSEYRRFPVLDPELGRMLAQQARRVRATYGESTTYMFPQPKLSSSKYRSVRPWTASGFAGAIEKLYIERGITESSLTGELVSGQDIHRFWHTIGTQLLNAGWTQPQVQEFLGHESAIMTAAYAKILDETMHKKADEFHRLVQAERAAEGRSYSDPVVERLRQLSTAVTPLGFCNLPASQHCSARDNPCLPCNFFQPGAGESTKAARASYRENLVLRIEKADGAGQTRIAEINRGILTNLDALEEPTDE